MSILRTTTIVTTEGLSVPFQHQSDVKILLADMFCSYYQARKNKRNTSSQIRFERSGLAVNLVELVNDIVNRNYKIGVSNCFIIHDPVKREVFAASFRDRIVHHYIFSKIEPFFEKKFIYDSYSCRIGKGTLFGIERLLHQMRAASQNFTNHDCWILKMDLKGYFMSISKQILYNLIINGLYPNALIPSNPHKAYLQNTLIYLLHTVIFHDPTKNFKRKSPASEWDDLPYGKSLFDTKQGCGLPIGNLTSQLFSNIYLNEFDQFVKRTLKIKYYGRYVDDFYLIGDRKKLLESMPKIREFLKQHLKLELNERKTSFQNVFHGVTFLGAYVNPYGIYLSKKSWKRMDGKLESILCEKDPYSRRAKLNSYLGYLSHFKQSKEIDYVRSYRYNISNPWI